MERHRKPIENIPHYNNNGAIVCIKIKNIYYPNEPWKIAYRDVVIIFTAIKQKLRPHTNFHNDDEFLLSLINYNEQDLKEVYEQNKADST